MVGLAGLKKHIENVRKCRMTLNNKYCYFQLTGLTIYDFLDILNYKSWLYKAYQKNVTMRYVNVIKDIKNGNATFRTSVGFAPLLLRFLRGKGFQILDQDIEVFRARNVAFPDLKINLYDFQQRMVKEWLNSGSIGVLKSPTGSGKCCLNNTLILTPNGLIKIEDIVKKISDSGNISKDINQLSLEDYIGEDYIGEDYIGEDYIGEDYIGEDYIGEDYIGDENQIYQENIKNVKSSISLSPKLKYEKYSISNRYDMGINDTITLETSTGYSITGTPEHKIIIIDKDGNLKFSKLENITDEDYIAITYNTNIFNDKLKLNYCFRTSKYDSNARFMYNIDYMNEDLARLIGYALSEGSDYGDRDSNITSYDKEMVDDMIGICNNIGLDPKFVFREGKNQENPIGIDIYSKSFREFLYYLGYRHGSKNKEIPWSILQADKNSQIAFIRALFDGDGTVYHKNVEDREEGKKYTEFVGYGSSSYEMCRQLQIMLLNIGIIASLKRKKGATLDYKGELRQYEDSWTLLITGNDLLKFAKTISFGLRRKIDILNKCVETLNSRERWTDIIYPFLDKKLKILYERLKSIGKKGEIVKFWNEAFDVSGKNITLKKSLSCKQYLLENDFDCLGRYVRGDVYPSKITLDKILYILDPNKDIEKSKEYQLYKYLKELSEIFIFDKISKINKGKGHVYDITVDNVHSYIGNGIINHNTIIGCSVIKYTGRKTLILVHTSDLLINVWNDSLIKTFGPGIMGQVGLVGGGLSDEDRMTMQVGVRSGDFHENMKKDIVIATFQTFVNHLDELSNYKFGLIIVDEAHHCPAQMFRKVNAAIRAPFKLGLSATLKRLDGMEKDVFGQMGDIQSSVTIRELINKGLLAEPRFQSPVIVDRQVIEEIDTCGHAGLAFSRFVKKASASSIKKKDYIVNVCKNVATRGRKFLLFADYVSAEDVFVRDMYADALLKEGVLVAIIDQGMSTEERSTVFKYLDAGEISGIVFGKLGSEGVNIPSVDVVVMANAIKSPITFCQRVGRVMRKTPGKEFCDVYEVLLDTKTEYRWSDFNFAEYRMEGFQKLIYKVE